jgi:hypothetical protein
MKRNKLSILSIFFILSVVFSACQGRPTQGSAPAGASTGSATLQAEPTLVNTVESTVEPTATATMASPTLDPEQGMMDLAEKTARDYFQAVEQGKSEEAAAYLSRFSLSVFEMTPDDAVVQLQAQKISGIQWSDLEIQKVERFDDKTMLVYLSYMEINKKAAEATAVPATALTPTAEAGQPQRVETIWPIRLEHKAWLFNWNKLIDFKSLSAGSPTVSGITVMPTELLRFTDRIELLMLVQNRNSETIVFGQTNETLGTFKFGDKAVVAEKVRWILNPLRSVDDLKLEIKGLYDTFPDTIEIRKWNDFDVKPWFVFQLD